MAAPSYVQAGSQVRGITSAEAGINISSFRERFDNPKEYIFDRYGGRTGYAYDYDPSSTATLEGEIKTALDSVFSASYGAALTVANSTSAAAYGTSTGDYTLDDLELSASRDAFQSASLTLTRLDGVTVA
jgi:hypothetical protein